MVEKAGSGKRRAQGFKLVVPLDASAIDQSESDQELRIVAEHRDGTLTDQVVRVGAGKTIAAELVFESDPGSARLFVGPAELSADEIVKTETISRKVARAAFLKPKETELAAIVITPYYWHLWPRWCRSITLRGRVACPDGSAVPGAEVCAFDVDRIWWWHSKQRVGCATTDQNGVFEITFRWCCGLGPLWWWQRRHWVLDPQMFEQLIPLTPRLKRPISVSSRPDFQVFSSVLSDDRLGPATIPGNDLSAIEEIRLQLVDRLAKPSIGLAQLWPWRPWRPWSDCSPDIVFSVEQDCGQGAEVILEEGFADTRWNVQNSRFDSLTAPDACCIEDDSEPEGECMIITRVCNDVLDTIGGNVGAPSTPSGYLNPGVAAATGDRPYAGVVPVHGIFGSTANVDYYEIQVDDGSGFATMPSLANGSFTRRYFDATLVGSGTNPFQNVAVAAQPVGGRIVYESRLHYELANAPGSWGVTRWWVLNRDLLTRWLTENNFDDGEYRLRVRAWDFTAPDTLDNPRDLPICGSQDENYVVIRLDNRIEGLHPTSPDHPCGPGTVHGCWTEPDTDIIQVRINGTVVAPCAVVDASAGGTLEIDFLADDPDGHLAAYSLTATYGENQIVMLLGLPSANVEPLLTPAIVPAAVQVGPEYGEARSGAGFNGAPILARPAAAAPTWRGGAMRYTLTNLEQAFPSTCAYQLELSACKRTIYNCNHNYPHRNLSQYTITVQV